ncbi:DUF397 domain-containing protein [Allonocardiopsis opalescens]|uniref:Uncharacterized protein DUF397 n=1 Tax=Allonocardiopsis opalescens TaxID=1144618 RepID=A0A2T0PYQ6_9ACTN|nr:DUF397 domain-containing protein [Allonocardiopsis opalescens]PRX96676.1 uncharacterized protein DUF397 [Allonocardiopsis opalescens]
MNDIQWHKSIYSGSGGSCVEVAEGPTVLVRDTKNRDQGHLAIPAAEWARFIEHVKTAH